ncbi:MAG: SBBP repeat-containing protein [Bacteroidia bacterium]|nr:SBBP repeat-containing protein [Bacteroidia bacterium]
MKKQLQATVLSLFISLYGFSQGVTFDWAKKLGGAGTDAAYAATVDASGNIYSTGHFNGNANFNPGGTFNLSSAGLSDIFVSKLDANGDFVWAFKIGGTANDFAYSIAVDGLNNIYICGYFNNTVDFDPGAGTTNLVSGGSADAFIAKYTSAGAFVWAKKIGGTSFDIAYSLALDASANVYTTGYYHGTVNFNPGGTFNMTSMLASADVFVTKFDTGGNFVWAKSMGGDDSDVAYKLTLDNAANVIVTGQFEGIADFDPNASTANLISLGASDIFVVKLTTAGNYVWANRMGGTLTDESGSVATDNAGNIYAGGRFAGVADFGLTVLTSNGFNDAYLTKLDASGTFLWAKQFGGADNDAVYGVQTDTNGDVYCTGYFSSTVDFDPSLATHSFISYGSADVFLAKYSSSGNYVWARQMGGVGFDAGLNLYVISPSTIYTVGSFNNMAYFNLPTSFNLTASGSSDAFVHKLKPCTITYGAISASACASSGGYVLNSETYTTSGTYTQTLVNAAGCDSILTVNVYISSVMSATITSANITCVGANNGTASITSVNGGTPPYSYSWGPSGGTAATATNLSAATYTCVITDSVGCGTAQYAVITEPNQTQIPEICMVTVDGQSVNNIIYWDRTAYTQADSFIVHREVSTNLYKRIGAVSASATGELIDTARSVGPANGNPNVGSYRYKLQMRDTCGNYSALSPYHNTIYIIDAGLGQFVWSVPYTIEGGSNPVSNYILLCDTANVDVWGPVATVAGTQVSATDPGFATHASTANWRVKTDWSITCDPARATINTTRSNIKGAAMVTNINEVLNMFVSVYPNPATNNITIQIPQLPSIPTIVIYNTVGQIVYQQTITQLTEIVNIEGYARGMYTVSIQTQYGNVYKKLIIQ